MKEKIQVIIADDHPMFLEGVFQALNDEEDISIVGSAASGEETIQLVMHHFPDILLLDITMPGKSGIEVTKYLSAAVPVTSIVILTASENEDDLLLALKAGARGYILKGISSKNLVEVIRIIADGGTFISPELANLILFELSHPDTNDPFTELTDREKEILNLVSEGLTNREIAEMIFLSEKTVKHYMTNILQKLHVRSRVQAALLAQKRKLK